MKTKIARVAIMAMVLVGALTAVAYADPLDDAGDRIYAFLERAGLIATGLVPAAGILSIGVLSIRRNLAKASGDSEVVSRTSGQIVDVLIYVAIGAGASLLVAIAGAVFKTV